MSEAASFIQLTKQVLGWTVNVQLVITETSEEAIAEAKQACLGLARELANELVPNFGNGF